MIKIDSRRNVNQKHEYLVNALGLKRRQFLVKPNHSFLHEVVSVTTCPSKSNDSCILGQPWCKQPVQNQKRILIHAGFSKNLPECDIVQGRSSPLLYPN